MVHGRPDQSDAQTGTVAGPPYLKRRAGHRKETRPLKVVYPIMVAFYQNGIGVDLLVTQCASRRAMARRAQGLADEHDVIIFVANAKTHLLLGWACPRRWEARDG